MSPLRVMIVDDHQVVREGLRKVLEVEENIEVVGEAGDGRQAVDKAQELKPDVILMDVMMPGMNGIDACQEIKGLLPRTAVVMLTASGLAESVTASLVAGAQGYVLKVVGRDELVRAIRAVGRGESILDPSVTRIVTEGFSRLVGQERQREVERLTSREKEVLLLVARGETNREVAERLVISEFTARNTVSNILGKLGLRNRSELVRWALNNRVVMEPGNYS
ncbi:MAG: response regulator transcription factor [Chloroflexi bacterium]|nr:response regulator transcription factor [Chloroflexota bacterium]